MVCAHCQHEMSATTRFCTQCGNPGPPAPATGAEDASVATGGGTGTMPTAGVTPALGTTTPATGTTQLLELPPEAPRGAWESPTSHRVREIAGDTRRWWRDAGVELQLAVAGTLGVLVAFFLLPFAAQVGTAAELGGRVWWRPITAVTATILIAVALRPGTTPAGAQARIVTALALSTAGATEAGLLGLLTGNGEGLRAGYWTMLAGLAVVVLASFLATRHPVREARGRY